MCSSDGTKVSVGNWIYLNIFGIELSVSFHSIGCETQWMAEQLYHLDTTVLLR